MDKIEDRKGDESSQELAEERTDLAEERTLWADQRTYLAQQRTFAGWIRTGLATTAVGLGIVEFIGQEEPAWLIRSVGATMTLLGALIPILALIGYRKVDTDLRRNDRPGSSIALPWLVLIAILMSVLAMGATAFIIL